MKIITISFSNQYTLQETTLLMQNYYDSQDNEVYSITSSKIVFNSFAKSEKIFFVNCPKKPGLSVDTFKNQEFNRVLQIIETINPTHILYYSSHLWNIKVIKKIDKKIKVLHVIHDVVPHDRLIKKFLINLYNKKITSMCDRIIVHSRAYISLAKKKFKIDSSQIKYLPVLRRFGDIESIHSTGNFLFFGRISKYKGIEYLVEIVDKCKEQKFLIIGKFSNDVKKYKNILTKYDNVYIDDNYVTEYKMKQYIQNSDWFILPYKSASQSGVIPDAYVYSRPVIAFNVGNIEEQITTDTGFLIEKDNIIEFINAIKKCSIMSEREHKEYCKNAYNYGVKNYSLVSNKSNFYNLFK